MASRRPVLVITPGDPEGVGPEVVWKAIRSPANARRWKGYDLLCVGARKPFDRLGAPVIEAREEELDPPRGGKPAVWLLPAPERSPRFLPGFQSGWSIEAAVRLIRGGRAHALVTGPISKERLQKGGYPYFGHTDLLADLCASGRVRAPGRKTRAASADEPDSVTMMLANDQLRISLVTTHLAYKDVPRALTRARIRRAVSQTANHLREWWGIGRPHVAVAALNPHAGESGILGREEIQVIEPELRALRAAARGRYVLSGPLPADTLFANHIGAPAKKRYDAVVCMYHDQGLIPVKLLDFRKTVNVTLGLPIVRTSVDHGVAFDIAGKGVADPTSFESAVDLAIQILKRKIR